MAQKKHIRFDWAIKRLLRQKAHFGILEGFLSELIGTEFYGIHNRQLLELSASQKKFFQKEKVAHVFPEIYLIKVNNFDDSAKDTLDEWIYFLKNSEIKQEFTAKGLKEADEKLKVANMDSADRRDYERFLDVLHDRASIAETIEIESELKVQKKAEELVEKAVERAVGKAVEDTTRSAVIKMLQNTNLTIEEIAKIQGVSVELVERIKKEAKE